MSETDGDVDLFGTNVVHSTTSTIKLQWRAVESATVYKIEQHFKRSNWTQVGWTAETSILIERLEDNFCFLFRVSALEYIEEQEKYTVLATSVNVPVSNIDYNKFCSISSLNLLHGHRVVHKLLLHQHNAFIELSERDKSSWLSDCYDVDPV